MISNLKMKSNETSRRSIIKSITYRVYQSFLVTPLIAYIITGNVGIAVKFSVIEFLVKIPAYYLFERIWSLVSYGYKYIDIKRIKKNE